MFSPRIFENTRSPRGYGKRIKLYPSRPSGKGLNKLENTTLHPLSNNQFNGLEECTLSAGAIMKTLGVDIFGKALFWDMGDTRADFFHLVES
jgi:hypothetical protein